MVGGLLGLLMGIHNKFLSKKGRGQRMKHFKKAVVISMISIFLLSGTIPAFCQHATPPPPPAPSPHRTVDEQRFVPETPQQGINKANEDTLRYQQQVPPQGGTMDKKKETPARPAQQPPSAP
jgi:hypothetical protein